MPTPRQDAVMQYIANNGFPEVMGLNTALWPSEEAIINAKNGYQSTEMDWPTFNDVVEALNCNGGTLKNVFIAGALAAP